MAKQSRAKRSSNALESISIDPTTVAGHIPTENVTGLPFSLNLQKPEFSEEPTPEEQKEFYVPALSNEEKTAHLNKKEPESDGMGGDISKLPAKIINLDPEAVKFDINQEKIDEYKKLVPTLKIKDADDAEGFKKVNETRLILKNARLNAQKKAEAAIAPAKTYIKDITGKFTIYEDQLKSLESPLKKLEEWYDEERKKVEAALELRSKTRAAFLASNGCSFDGTNYRYEDVVITEDQIKSLPDDVFAKIEEQVKAAHEEALEVEKKAAEKLKEQQNELTEQQKQIVEFKKYQLTTIGLTDDPAINQFYFKNEQGSITVTYNEIETLNAAAWSAKITDCIAKISRYKAKQSESDNQTKSATQQSVKDAANSFLEEIIDSPGKDILIVDMLARKHQLEALGFASVENTPGIAFRHTQFDLSFSEENYLTADVNSWNSALQIITDAVTKANRQKIKAESRRGDLRALGLVVEDVNLPEGGTMRKFVYRGVHVFKAFAPDIEERLLVKSDEEWLSLLVTVSNAVQNLKDTDQQQITESLNEETKTRDAAKNDNEKFQDLKNKIHQFISELPQDMTEDTSKGLILRIHTGLEKTLTLIDEQMQVLTR